MDILWALPVMAASFVFQVRPRLGNRYFGIDTWRHLAVAEHYRRRRRGEVRDFDRYLIPERSDYPPLLRILLSWIPKRVLDSSQWFLSPVVDAVHSVVLFGLAYRLTGDVGAAVVAQIAYGLAPLIVMENSNLSTRSLASLMFSLLMISYLAFHSSGNWVLILVSVAVGTMLFLTHRMALQALLALTIVLSLWFQTPYYVLVFAGSWLMAIVVSGGFYWRVFKGHLAMLWWWRTNIHNRYAHQFRGLPDKDDQSGDPVFRIYQLVRNAPFIAVFAGNAFVLFPIVVAVDRSFELGLLRPAVWDFQLSFVLVWALTLLTTGVLIRQVRQVEWLGEGERYGEYAAFPTALAVAASVTTVQSNLVWLPWLAFGVVAVVCGLVPALYLQQRVVAKDVSRSMTPELREVLEAVDAIKSRPNLITFPLFLADFALYFTKARVFSTDSSFGHMHHYQGVWPVFDSPLAEILRRYDVDYVLVNESYVGRDEIGIEQAPIQAQAGPFCLVDVRVVDEGDS